MDANSHYSIGKPKDPDDDWQPLKLHEAAKRYDATLLRSLLESGQCDIQALNSQGQNVLHVLLENGFLGHLNETSLVKCLRLALSFGADANHKDINGKGPLTLAVENMLPACTLILIQNNADCDIQLATKIAYSMPDVLLKMFDDGISAEDFDVKGKPLVTLNWRPLLQYPHHSHEFRGFKHEQKETQFLNSVLDVDPTIRQKLLSHPLVEAFVYLRNSVLQRKFILFMVISVLFPICYGVFIWFLYFEECKLQPDPVRVGQIARCEISWPVSISAGVLLFILGCWTLVEIFLLFRVDRTYLISWRTMVARVSFVVMGVTLWPGLFYQKGYDITWQYPIASLGILLAWVMLLIQVGLYQRVSIYLEMLVKILLSVLRIILMFLPLFFGFYMGFNLFFSDMRSVFSFVMMSVDAGSVGYEQFVDNAEGLDRWFQSLAYIFCVAFLIVIAIVFMNFLLAVSVRDVDALKGQAKLASTSRIIQNLFVVDLITSKALLIKKEDLAKGNYLFQYDPTQANQKLPEDIRMKITLLLKRKKEERERTERFQQEMDILHSMERFSENTVGSNSTRMLLQRIKELEDKVNNLVKEESF